MGLAAEAHRISQLDFTPSYLGERYGSAPHLFGPSYVRGKNSLEPLWWARCQVCSSIDLLSGYNILRGTFCAECQHTRHDPFAYDSSSVPSGPNPLMRAVNTDLQQAMCAALILGGFAAVEALAGREIKDDQG